MHQFKCMHTPRTRTGTKGGRGTNDSGQIAFLQDVLPRLGLDWAGFRRVRGQVCKRISRRVRALGLADLRSYRGRLDEDANEWAVLDGLCRVTISRFYRDRAVFDRLRERELPRLARRALGEGRALRCWSAGCASGEEAYSLALALRLGLSPPAPFSLVATDADSHLIERAQTALYHPATLRALPAAWRERAFVAEGDQMRLLPDYREGIELARADIRREMPKGPFDLVLCRNLAFTYFAQPLREKVLTQIAERTLGGGLLVIGAHETLPTIQGWRRETPLPIYEKIER